MTMGSIGTLSLLGTVFVKKKKKTVVGQKFNVVTCNINYSSYHTTKIVMNCLRIQVIYISSPDEGLNDLEDIDPVAD